MPKRSNRLQKLVYLIERQLSGSADVAQSVEIPDRDTGKPREVDVVIGIASGLHRIRVGIEATSGRAGTPWVEKMICKHKEGGLSDKLILVAEKGFSAPADKKAKMHGCETVTLKEAEALDWTCIVGKYKKLWFSRVVLTPIDTSLDLAIPPNANSEIQIGPNTEIRSANGKKRTTLKRLVHDVLSRAQILQEVYNREDREALTQFSADGVPGEECFVIDGQGNRRRILKLHVQGKLRFTIDPFDVTSSEYKGVPVGYGEFTLDGKTALAAIVENPDSQLSFSINLSTGKNDPGEVVDLTPAQQGGDL